jgi:hypothetical protein
MGTAKSFAGEAQDDVNPVILRRSRRIFHFTILTEPFDWVCETARSFATKAQDDRRVGSAGSFASEAQDDGRVSTARSFAIPDLFTAGTGEAQDDVNPVILSEAKNLSSPDPDGTI